jgi:hypothetical protein
MKGFITMRFLGVTGTVLSAVVLASCSGGTPSLTPAQASLTPGSNLRPASAVRRSVLETAGKGPRDLYIGDTGLNVVLRLHNKSYRDDGFIAGGINYPIAVALDRQSRLYVADTIGGNVTEYTPGNTSGPIFTYSAGMNNPTAVATDAHGNLFEGDVAESINEYYQGLNTVVASCPTEGSVGGVAVDASGDVFIDEGPAPGYLFEYAGGLGGACNAQLLGPVMVTSAGIALDAKNNLLVCNGNAVDVVPPPYSTISGTIGSGFHGAVNVTLNKANTQAFVTDSSNNTVTVVSYPGGTNLRVLGAADGLNAPKAAVDWPDAVY